MAQALQPDQGSPAGTVPARKPNAEPREPATAAALWPTFMRRTLTEEALCAPQRPAPDAASP